MEKAISIIEAWLKVSDTQHIRNDAHLINAIYSLCEENTKYNVLFDNIVKQFFQFARSENEEKCISMGDKKSVSNVEVALLALYNKEVLSEKGLTKIATFRLPTLARQSIYHETDRISSAFFTTDSLQRYEAGDAANIRWGLAKQISKVTAACRYHFITALLIAFNARLSSFPKVTLMQLILNTSKLVSQGFSKSGHLQKTSAVGAESSWGNVYPRIVPRISVTSDLLAELVQAVYFAMFNGFGNLGMQAIEDLHMRAQYELLPDVLLMTNAVKNTIKLNQFGEEDEIESVGIINTTTLTPSMATVVSKSYITNASFRTKKLPDDIPIQSKDSGQQQNDSTRSALKSITEGSDEAKDLLGKESTTKSGKNSLLLTASKENKESKEKSRLSANLPPLSGFVKKREKEKVKNGVEKKDGDRRSVERDRKVKEAKGGAAGDSNPIKNNGSSPLNSDTAGFHQSVNDGVVSSKESFSTEAQPYQQADAFAVSKGDSFIEMTSLRIDEVSDDIKQSCCTDLNSSQSAKVA